MNTAEKYTIDRIYVMFIDTCRGAVIYNNNRLLYNRAQDRIKTGRVSNRAARIYQRPNKVSEIQGRWRPIIPHKTEKDRAQDRIGPYKKTDSLTKNNEHDLCSSNASEYRNEVYPDRIIISPVIDTCRGAVII